MRNREGGLMKGESWRSNHKKEPWRSNHWHEGRIMKEES